MIKKFILLISFVSLLIISTHGQTTKIYGKVENATGYEIKLKAYSDYFSMTEEQLTQCVIGSDGSFLLETDPLDTKLYVLVIGFQRAEIYLEPDKAYQLLIKYDKNRELITFVNKAYLNFQFVELPVDDLNTRIADFSSQTNNFLVTNFDRIYKRRDKKVINDFSKTIKDAFRNSSEFLKNYIDFRIASMEYSSGLKGRLTIFENYFLNKNILYTNEKYVQFFKELFDKYLMKPNPYFEIQQIKNEIFGQADLELIFSVLNNDPLLQNRELKELVLLKSLYDLYFISSNNKIAILSLISNVGKSSQFSEIEIVASNIFNQLTFLRPGNDFPSDFFKDGNAESKFTDRSEKSFFISFFTIPCADCLREMDSIAKLHKKYSKDVQFISIALNADDSEIDNLVKDKNYSWEIIHATHDFKLAETYQIKSLPAYFLINSKGKILLNPALSPWKGFSPSFKSVFKY